MNDLKELEKKYKELGEEIQKLKKGEQDVQNDPIFLLSVEEYAKYKKKIPPVNCCWWLRSPGKSHSNAVDVSSDHSIYNSGSYVRFDQSGVRPVLRLDPEEWFFEYLQDRMVLCGVTWIEIDSGLYISEVPIAFRRFDEKDNNYQTSEIRQFLINWYAERQNW